MFVDVCYFMDVGCRKLVSGIFIFVLLSWRKRI